MSKGCMWAFYVICEKHAYAGKSFVVAKDNYFVPLLSTCCGFVLSNYNLYIKLYYSYKIQNQTRVQWLKPARTQYLPIHILY